MENNILLKTDSYKISHHRQYPPNITTVFSYLESRGGNYPEQVFFDLQYILKKHLIGQVVTKENLAQTTQFWSEHFGSYIIDKEIWQYIIEKYDGHLPIRIKAVPEGTVIPSGNVLMTIENTDPKCVSLTTFLETILLQIWYPITIATNSREIKKILLKALKRTGDPSMIKAQLHDFDFGFRSVSSYETSAIGACGHLTSFYRTDTISGCVLARNYYLAKEIAAYSIPETDHSAMISWTFKRERDAYENILDTYLTGTVACVSDSYNIYNACEFIWGETLHEKLMARDGTLIIRSDFGDPIEILECLLNILYVKFGGHINEKGFKVLDRHVPIMQDDDVDIKSIIEIVILLEKIGFSADNLLFGSSSCLLQTFDRDKMKFTVNCSYLEINGMGSLSVDEDLITDKGKHSKIGRLKLVKDNDGNYRTLSSIEYSEEYEKAEDQLVIVFENGKLLQEYSLETIRAACDIDLDRLDFMHIMQTETFS